ncbi:unnamed protein product [Rhodiola kirilowii]
MFSVFLPVGGLVVLLYFGMMTLRICNSENSSEQAILGFCRELFVVASFKGWRVSEMSSRTARPIFCGNLDYDARQSDIERLFGKYGNVERVDLKSGFAFVYMEDEQDADDAVRRLDRREFGAKGRRLRVEWTKASSLQDRGGRRSDDSRKGSMNSKPSRTLFVINFDPINTRPRDLERHFDPYGKIVNVRIRRNFAFVQFDTQEEATKALDATNSSKFMDRIISVEYATRDDDDNQRADSRRNGRSPDRRGRDRSPERGYGGRRSPSPYRRDRESPDYGHGSKPVTRYEPRRSPSYERTDKSPINNMETRRSSHLERRRSPSYERKRSPSYDRKRSPIYERKRSPSYERKRSPSYERKRSPSYDAPDKSPVNERGTKLSYDGPDRSPVNDSVVHQSYVGPDSPANGRGTHLDSEDVPYKSPSYDRAERSPGGERYYSRSPSPTERSRD